MTSRLNAYWPRLAGLFLLGVIGFAAHAGEEGESPPSVEGATTIDIPEAQRLHAAGVKFIDVRNPRLFARRHVPGAIHLNLTDDFNLANLSATVGKDEPFVIYCSGITCSRSSDAAAWAVEWGFSQVKYFREGMAGWRDAGLPMVTSDD
ncbi:MAG: rhodanese-like domain-containing protein [Gammaproteobacteria bacterium]|nr:rhodanese-like domain-containing protein [Gammaproteobacteria bacterium]